MKLQQGDYVEGLTKEQFDELIGIENYILRLRYQHTDNKEDKKLTYECDGLFRYNCNSISKLSFTEFKQRAINTFER